MTLLRVAVLVLAARATRCTPDEAAEAARRADEVAFSPACTSLQGPPTPAEHPGCTTYHLHGQKECLTTYATCEVVTGTCQDVRFGATQAWCFDGCTTVKYSNGVPGCVLAGSAGQPCLVAWDDTVPRCLTDACGTPVSACDRRAWCPEPGSGVYCFDSCTASAINWLQGVPRCDAGATPCDATGAAPVCGGAAATPAPTAYQTIAATPAATPVPTPAPTAAAEPYIPCGTMNNPVYAAIGAWTVYGMDLNVGSQGYPDGATDVTFTQDTIVPMNGASVAPMPGLDISAVTCADVSAVAESSFSTVPVSWVSGVTYIVRTQPVGSAVYSEVWQRVNQPGEFYRREVH